MHFSSLIVCSATVCKHPRCQLLHEANNEADREIRIIDKSEVTIDLDDGWRGDRQSADGLQNLPCAPNNHIAAGGDTRAPLVALRGSGVALGFGEEAEVVDQ